ncbi:MAG: HEAT repeat domain-containing protein [Desulfobulbaceae bacterium]|nr:HEAT repeat domain-containing protein [Desulfobulbaceae bacterium]HIJ90946.1 HEAT repeat domain-containing protein [Deltaproteobacteria bacterium]
MVSQRSLKKHLLTLLSEPDVGRILAELAGHPPEALLNALFSGICHADLQTRWHAVTAMGATVSRLADQDMETARIVMRRFMWSLNDESGGIGWGAPEAMAECLACHAGLADEYTKILVSFMREDGFYLELPALQQGLMWGVARLAPVHPDLLHFWNAPRYLLPYLDSDDPVVRALAARALGLLGVCDAAPAIRRLLNDSSSFILFADGRFTQVSTTELAQEAIDALIPAAP